MYTIIASKRFKKDYKLAKKRGLDVTLLDELIITLEETGTVPENLRPHRLIGNYKNCIECHIEPDWLLVWQVFEEDHLIYLIRTGTHSDLF